MTRRHRVSIRRWITLLVMVPLLLSGCQGSPAPPSTTPEPSPAASEAAPASVEADPTAIATAAPSPQSAASGATAAPQPTATPGPAPPTVTPTAAAVPTPTAPAASSPPPGGWPEYVVSGTAGTGLWLRRTPGGQQLTIYREGSRLQQLSPDQEAQGLTWRNVRTQDGTEGWMAARYLALEIFVVIGTEREGLKLRRTPGGEPLGTYREFTRLDQIGPDRDLDGMLWRNVRAPGDAEGWVAAEYTVLASQAPPPPVAGPSRLVIPTIGVDAAVEPVGLTHDGAMDVPSGPHTVGWYHFGSPPGAVGSAVMDGHVDYRGVGPAVFWRLRELAPGDTLVVVTEDGDERRFRVTEVASYPNASVPMERIFGSAASPRLNLITCDGAFIARDRNYDHRLVVYSEAIE